MYVRDTFMVAKSFWHFYPTIMWKMAVTDEDEGVHLRLTRLLTY
jgi:hypothetical protein